MKLVSSGFMPEPTMPSAVETSADLARVYRAAERRWFSTRLREVTGESHKVKERFCVRAVTLISHWYKMLTHERKAPMKIRPLHDRVLVKRLDAAVVSPGGIIIPENAKEKPHEGIVVAVGNGKRLDNGTLLKPDVSEGDKVLFGKFSGQEVKSGDDKLVVLRQDEILAVLEG